jgi:hypothetical protein
MNIKLRGFDTSEEKDTKLTKKINFKGNTTLEADIKIVNLPDQN